MRTGRTFESLKGRNYRLYFVAELISHTGGWMHTMAEVWLVFSLTRSGTAVGATLAFRFAPVFALGLWGGAIADRFDRRTLLMVTQLGQAALALVLWMLVGTGVVHVWMVYAVALALGLVTAIDQPASHAFVEEMVGPERLANAVALNSAVLNSARMTGPALAGLIVAVTGTSWVFLCNAVSFLAVVAALLAMDAEELRPLRRSKTSVRIRDGLHHAWSVREIRATVIFLAVVGTLVYNFPTFLTILARDTFDGGADVAGLLMAILGAGTLVGSLVAARVANPTRRAVLGSGACLGAVLILAALVPNRALVAGSLVPVGAVAVFFGATAGAHMQAVSAQQFRGRVMAVYTMLTLGSTIIGGPLMGAVSGRWGARTGFGVAGAATMVTAAAVSLLERKAAAAPLDDLTHVEATELAVEAAT